MNPFIPIEMRRNKLVVLTITDKQSALSRLAEPKDYNQPKKAWLHVLRFFGIAYQPMYVKADIIRCPDAKRAASILLNKGFKEGKVKSVSWYDDRGRKLDLIRNYKKV
jgi:hypothetical protein